LGGYATQSTNSRRFLDRFLFEKFTGGKAGAAPGIYNIIVMIRTFCTSDKFPVLYLVSLQSHIKPELPAALHFPPPSYNQY
jgi:hypothetical protein